MRLEVLEEHITSPNKGDDLMMDDDMMTRLGKIGIGMIRKEKMEAKGCA